MKAIRLKTEYLTAPLGIDVRQPRLQWNCDGGVQQTAYQIVTESWDSGRVESASMHAAYPLPLHSRERVQWKIRLWDENGAAGEWAESCFEMGLLEKADWTARWITGDYTPRKKERYPVDCFRKGFAVAGEVQSARLYATACGLYEARLNGAKAGRFCLAPGHTDYRKRVQYQTCDVTALLHSGDNEITVDLADGWYQGQLRCLGPHQSVRYPDQAPLPVGNHLCRRHTPDCGHRRYLAVVQ